MGVPSKSTGVFCSVSFRELVVKFTAGANDQRVKRSRDITSSVWKFSDLCVYFQTFYLRSACRMSHFICLCFNFMPSTAFEHAA